MTEAQFIQLTQHLEALCFWSEAGLTAMPAPWHFDPREFVTAFRLCGWLSLTEMTQLIPRKSQSNGHTKTIDWNDAQLTINGDNTQTDLSYSDINKMFAKYGFDSVIRRIAFFSQSYIETGVLALIREVGKGADNPKLPMTKYYGPFYGRGLMQLTWPSNFEDYGRYRNFADNTSSTYSDNRITATSTHSWQAPEKDKKGVLLDTKRQWFPRYDPDLVASEVYNSCHSAGFYWVTKHFTGLTNISRIADAGITAETVGKMSVLVNGGGNGYYERQQYAAFICRYLSDTTDVGKTGSISVTKLSIRKGQWVNGSVSNVAVDYTPQRP